jgi:hypothetical protein
MYLNKSQPINTIAWLPEAPPSILPTAIYFSGSSEYNQNGVTLVGDVISTSTTPYIITQISASYIPAASGWYLVDTYYADADLLTWAGSAIAWNDANYNWNSAGFANTPFDTLIIFVSGSNNPQYINYISSNETGSFTRYISGNETGNFTTYISSNESGSYTRYISANESGSFVRYVSSNEIGYYTTKNN